MLSKRMIVLAAAVSLGAAALGPDNAWAQMRGGFGGMHGGGFGGMHGGFGGMHGGFGGMRGGFGGMPGGFAGGFRGHFAPSVAIHNRFAFRDRFAFRNRFAFRHHFFPVRHRFAFATVPFFAGDGCLRLRHVWTAWGWTWRRVWVC